jgi:hypothetical protein
MVQGTAKQESRKDSIMQNYYVKRLQAGKILLEKQKRMMFLV